MKKLKSANDNGRAALSFEEAVEVWLRHWRGEFQHVIAAQFGVNPGRVNDVLKERKHAGSRHEAEKRWQKPA